MAAAGVAPPIPPRRQRTLESDSIPDEPPPAYSSVVGANAPEVVLEQGPAFPAFATQGSSGGGPVVYRAPNAAFAPPPPGPQRIQTQPGGAYAPPPRPPGSANSAGGSDGEPTTVPTAGRALLRDGRILVYPRGFTCPKCDNSGYKHFDPSHPCRKCWERYSKVWHVVRHSPHDGVSTMQRPLPHFVPSPGAGVPASTYVQQHQQQPGSNPWGNPPRQSSPGVWGPQPQPPRHSGYHQPMAPVPVSANRPPPGALVVGPGDPRIGGQLCFQCNGRGQVDSLGLGFFLAMEETCPRCRGMGRVF